jgi:nucleotide-binding universal stress UspA family protein
MQRILVATDFSEHGERAFQHAASLARLHGAALELLHAIFVPSLWALEGGVPMSQALVEDLIRSAQEQLEQRAGPLRQEGLEVRCRVVEDLPAAAICAVARAERVDLIALGTHGRRGVSHVLLGSVAERVLRLAPCPVLTVRADAPAPGSIERILVPTDFSPDAEAALRWARDLARRSAAAVQLVHAITPPYGLGIAELSSDHPYLREREQWARGQLAELERELGPARSEVLAGHPDVAVLEACERHKPDLIVVGSRGRSGLAHVVLGSTAERIVRRAPVPVVTVKRP